jgi:hypothetical protein
MQMPLIRYTVYPCKSYATRHAVRQMAERTGAEGDPA